VLYLSSTEWFLEIDQTKETGWPVMIDGVGMKESDKVKRWITLGMVCRVF
jgi:hypothetical protein